MLSSPLLPRASSARTSPSERCGAADAPRIVLVTIDTLGGYRVVRKLGEGARAEVYLGYPCASQSPPAALKHYRAGVSQSSVMIEVEALSRASGDHVVELLDLSTAADGRSVLLLQRLPGASLGRFLQERGSVRLGEAITILAPIAITIARLHAAGVAHTAIDADAVLFDSTGAPVLARFGSSSLITPGMSDAALRAQPLVVADLEGLDRIVSGVLRAVHHDDAADISAWFADRARQAPERAAHELASRLFAIGIAEPVNFLEPEPAHSRGPSDVPNRLCPPDSATHVAIPITTMRGRSVVGVLRRVQQLLVSRSWWPRLHSAVALVRPRVWLMAAAVAVSLVTAMVLVPPDSSDATPATEVVATNRSSDISESTNGPVDANSPVGADDPVEALHVLLTARERCLHDLSVLCLDSIGQPGSSALSNDQQRIRELQSGGETAESWHIAAVTLEERLGDSALVTVDDPADSEPASFLLVKGEAGWRIRDYLWG